MIPSWTETDTFCGRTTATWIFSRRRPPAPHIQKEKVSSITDGKGSVTEALILKLFFESSCHKKAPCVLLENKFICCCCCTAAASFGDFKLV